LLKWRSHAWLQSCCLKKVIPTSVDTDMDNKVSPVAQHILDNNRVDSSHYSRDSESEGGIWDNNNVDNVSLAPEGGN